MNKDELERIARPVLVELFPDHATRPRDVGDRAMRVYTHLLATQPHVIDAMVRNFKGSDPYQVLKRRV